MTMTSTGTNRKLKVDIFESRLDGNAHAILRAFYKQAKREGWPDEDINFVLEKAKSGTYDQLLQTLMSYVE